MTTDNDLNRTGRPDDQRTRWRKRWLGSVIPDVGDPDLRAIRDDALAEVSPGARPRSDHGRDDNDPTPPPAA